MDTLPQELRESIARALPTGRNRTALASVSRSLRNNIPANIRNERVTRRRWVSARYTTMRMPRLDIVFFCTRALQYNPIPSLIPWAEGSVFSANGTERNIMHNANPFSVFSAIALFLGEITCQCHKCCRECSFSTRRPFFVVCFFVVGTGHCYIL